MVPTLNRRNERGFSLVEVLVASAVLVVVLVAVLLLYDRANKTFKTANEAAEMQQNVRIAYDRIVGDIRMAGFDYKRGGPMLPGQSASPWAPNRQYSPGTIVTPTVANGHTYRATNAGVSGGVQPGWTIGTGDIVVEAGATPVIRWQENGGAVYEQPDEQIEYAGATALTIRGNFDYSVNPNADDHGREENLEATSRFPVVTTGNDEIVTYALVPMSATAATTSIDMFVDVNNAAPAARDAHPGGSAEERKTITGIDLTNSQPPYTLMRFSFEDDGSVRRTPLADNIRSLNFLYYQDTAGQVPLRDGASPPALAPNIGGLGQFSPTVANSQNHPDRLVRRTIRSIRVRLVGMSSQPDSKFQDTSTAVGQLSSTTTAGVPVFTTEANPLAINYRRLAVDALIAPRNLGVTGLPQNFLQPPPEPTLTSVCTGYCGIVVVNWNPNSPSPNASFAVMWDTVQTGSYSNVLNAGTSNTFAVDLTQQDLTQTFYFKVRAFNAGGAVMSTNFLQASGANATRPNPPNTLVATGGAAIAVPGKIVLTWASPTTTSGSPTCTAGVFTVSNYLREIQGFRIYRSTAPGTNASSATLIADENSPLITSDGYGNYTFEDEGVPCGSPQYYRIRTVEWCVRSPGSNTTGTTATSVSVETPINSAAGLMGQSGSAGTPRTPVNLIVDTTNSVCDSNPLVNLCRVFLNWSKVTTATNNATLAIDEYEIERVMYDSSTGTQTTCPTCAPPLMSATTNGPIDPAFFRPDALAIVGSTVDWVDNTAPMYNPANGVNFEYKYKVRALQTAPCPDGGYSTEVTFPPPCAFTGSVIVQAGASSGDGLTPQTAWVMNAGDSIQIDPPAATTFARTDMTIIDPSGVIITIPPISSFTSPAGFAWANLTPGDIYTVTFTMTNTAVPPCVEQIVRYIQQEPLPACALTTFATQNSILAQTATLYQLKLDLINAASEALDLDEIIFNWNRPANIAWNNIRFPTGGTFPLGGSPAATFTVDLTPKPVQLSTDDVKVPANGTLTLFLNFAATSGSPANVTSAVIPNICAKYTRPSITVPSGLPSVPVVSLTSSGTTATARTSTPHLVLTGDDVTISGATEPEYNGSFLVTVIDSTTFTYTLLAVSATSPATGTITMLDATRPFLFNCAIKPDQNINNPNTCN